MMRNAAFVLSALLPACTGSGYGTPEAVPMDFNGEQAAVWLNAFPNPISITWQTSITHCTSGYGPSCDGGEPHPFEIESVTCNGCDVLVETDTGFRALVASDINTNTYGGAQALYGQPTIVGDITFNAKLRSIDGVEQQASFHIAGDRVASLSAICNVVAWDDSLLGSCETMSSRPAKSTINGELNVTTEQGLSMSLEDNEPTGTGFAAFMPTMSPDNGDLVNGVFEIDAATVASETVTWNGVTQPLTIRIPPVAAR
jgi:hypothetical protein